MPELFPKHSFDIAVRFQTGQLAFKATQREYVVLLQRKYVVPVEYKHEFGYAKLVVPIRAALRLLSPLQVESSSHISKRKQGKGNKRWIERLDRADMGRTASFTPMVFEVASSVVENVPGVFRDGKPVSFPRSIVQ